MIHGYYNPPFGDESEGVGRGIKIESMQKMLPGAPNDSSNGAMLTYLVKKRAGIARLSL